MHNPHSPPHLKKPQYEEKRASNVMASTAPPPSAEWQSKQPVSFRIMRCDNSDYRAGINQRLTVCLRQKSRRQHILPCLEGCFCVADVTSQLVFCQTIIRRPAYFLW